MVLKRTVTSASGKLRKERHGAWSLCACGKQQLDGKTLRRHRLVSD